MSSKAELVIALEQEIHDTKVTITTTEAEKADTKAKLADTEAKLADTEAEHAALEAANRGGEQLDPGRFHFDHLSEQDRRSKLEFLASRIASHDSSIASLNSSIASLNSSIASLRSKLTDLQAKLERSVTSDAELGSDGTESSLPNATSKQLEESSHDARDGGGGGANEADMFSCGPTESSGDTITADEALMLLSERPVPSSLLSRAHHGDDGEALRHSLSLSAACSTPTQDTTQEWVGSQQRQRQILGRLTGKELLNLCAMVGVNIKRFGDRGGAGVTKGFVAQRVVESVDWNELLAALPQ